MAIDGTKIIDSDSGYDIYSSVVDRYRNGEDIELIRSEILLEEKNFCTNELYTEIYWTSFAYSLWKIGYLTENIKKKALEIINDGASILWAEYIDEKARKSRQKHLEKLAVQLKNENLKPIKPYKPRKTPLVPHFEVGDVLAVKMEQGYGACFVFMIDQTPRKIEYHLIPTRIFQDNIPTMEEVLTSTIAIAKTIIMPTNGQISNEDLREILNSSAVATTKKIIGICTDCWFSHKDLKEILSSFTKLGKVTFEDECKLCLLSPAKSLDDIYKQITREPSVRGFYLNDVYKIIKNIIEK